MKAILRLAIISLVCLGMTGQLDAAMSVFVQNPSFEDGVFNDANSNAWFGSTLDGWTIETPLPNWVGKDNGTALADNGQRPDRFHTVFLQAGYGVNSSIQHALDGLDTNAVYVLQFFHNAPAQDAAHIITNALFDVYVHGGAVTQWLGHGEYGYTNWPVDAQWNAGNPYHFAQIVFTPQLSQMSLCFRNVSWEYATNGGSALLLDAITLFALSHADEVIIRNPSFEASGIHPNHGQPYWGGLAPSLGQQLAGWDCTGFGFGTVTNPCDYLPVFSVPEGKTSYLRYNNDSNAMTKVEQAVSLVPGQLYELSFHYATLPHSVDFRPSNFSVHVGDTQVFFLAQIPTNEYFAANVEFTADNSNPMYLTFATDGNETATGQDFLLLDDVMIVLVPEPAGLLLAGLGLLALRRRG